MDKTTDASAGTSPDARDDAATVRIACSVYVREVPISVAAVPEATDYLVYLLGFDCYERWNAGDGHWF